MPDSNNQPLPPLNSEAYDGYREEAALHRDQPIPKTCTHKQIKILSATELRCGCGTGFTGANILKLYQLLTAS